MNKYYESNKTGQVIIVGDIFPFNNSIGDIISICHYNAGSGWNYMKESVLNLDYHEITKEEYLRKVGQC